ncbi:disease resistance protein RPV1-like [Eucalyptus grandis]|uniref:disease resistance protein RPV1-like n=1 Tax=Eucalyptus grandis TaxID=71139 RepID=UPI00192EAAE2|nr:disease resistance protein RPV1-like [Eucalyptus grandis]
MHRLIFGYSFAELVAPILLLGLTLYFLNKKKASVRGNADDADTGTYDSMIVPIDTNSVGSSSSPTETNNNASSSLTVSTGNHYEAFLSFRGLDIRHGFADHLYHGLRRVGIHTYRDDDELQQGADIRPELMAAITNSKVLIPIFSVNYGTSSWCLDELVQIMERKNNNEQKVLPIFYKVKPADVGHQIGSFGKAFHEREKRLLKRSSFNPAILEKWKQALLEVSNLKGHEADGSEVELVKLVVQEVLSELKKKFELIVSDNLVGIAGHVNNIMELLDDKSHALLFVGIHGMGGIGKTTLAKTVYNELSNQFEHRSFIADIRESWKRGAHVLQNQLIYDISNKRNEAHNKDEGINFISSRFKDKKVLLLLDDVDDVDQVKCLAGKHDWFSLGSIIIITSRNKRILEVAGVDHNYELTELDYEQSLILFSKHAFRKDVPPSEFEGLTREVVFTTGGLPLCLEVLGSLLCGKESKEWRDVIKKLEKIPRIEVQEKLRISYDVLDNGQKQIFLDIACFLIGTDKRIAFYMWDACDFFPGENIEVLTFMSLIKIGDDLEFRMHDQLRDLGRAIVREENEQQPWHRSRLWDSEEALKVLKRNKGTDKNEAIDLSKGNSEGLGKIDERDGNNYTAEQFKKLTSLRFLFMKGAHLSGDFEDSMEELKWLQWQSCPASFEVNNFHMRELVVLELKRSKINEKWEGWSFFKMAKKLKYLDLSFCRSLENTDFLSAFEKLEVLILRGCGRLKQIDASIEDIKGLLRLELDNCFYLRELPAELGKLKALQQLNLSETPFLFALLDSIGSLENLEILDITHSGIEELPNGIGSLRKLRELCACACKNLTGIMVESMCNLSSLRRLDFIDCFKLQSLPDLPSGLTYLGVTCQSRKLPSLSHLPHLKQLQVRDCGFIQCIQELPSMQLKSSECSQLTDIEEMESPQSLNTPFKFESLEVCWCESIKMLDVSQFVHLRTLVVCCCMDLFEIRALDKLIYLESLEIKRCHLIK